MALGATKQWRIPMCRKAENFPHFPRNSKANGRRAGKSARPRLKRSATIHEDCAQKVWAVRPGFSGCIFGTPPEPPNSGEFWAFCPDPPDSADRSWTFLLDRRISEPDFSPRAKYPNFWAARGAAGRSANFDTARARTGAVADSAKRYDFGSRRKSLLECSAPEAALNFCAGNS